MSTDSPSLSEVLKQHAVELPAEQVERLGRYCELLWDWNTKINLTRHTDFEKFVTRDLLDSLTFAEFLKPGEKVLDVGSGGGVPGVVLAILRPDLKVTLSDPVGKKARVLADIVSKLGLATPVFQGRAEEFLRETRQDTLVIRAVAKLAKLVEWFEPLMSRFDRILVLKGPSWIDERGEARHLGRMKQVSLRKIKSYRIQGIEAEGVLLELRRKGPGQEGDAEFGEPAEG